ncbi:MAG: TolC family protein [bacterium]|jgi:outer membrane protein TolC
MKKLTTLLLLLVASTLVILGQDGQVFTQRQLLWYIGNYHPVAQQGELLLNQGESSVRKARGSFDPYLRGSLDQKYFDDKTYFSILGTGLTIPTWYGIEVKTGFDQNRGQFLNPENTVPEAGLVFAGISIPVGQGLFIDERRATLKQAKLFAEATRAEQEKLMNDLYFDAIKLYWKWTQVWNQYQIYTEAVNLAQTRFEAVRQSYFLGDIPAIDTLESFIQVQNRQMKRNQYELLYQNITLELSNYLWFENNIPLEITDSLRPPVISDAKAGELITGDTLQQLISSLQDQHPDMQLYDYKLESMEVEKRLMVEGLKPEINLDYNALFDASGAELNGEYLAGNYKWGIEVNFPLLFRKQRGDVQLARIKIQDTRLGQQQKLLELENKVKSYYNEQLNLIGQLQLFSDAVINYERLFSGEKRKFDAGESSLFLVNSRETNLIQARLKLVEIIANYNVAQSGLIWASGMLYRQP